MSTSYSSKTNTSALISGTWAPGATDKPHSHPVPSVACALTDCTLQLTSADGKIVTVGPKVDSATVAPVIGSYYGSIRVADHLRGWPWLLHRGLFCSPVRCADPRGLNHSVLC